MARSLAEAHPDFIKLVTVDGADHNDVVALAEEGIVDWLAESR
jgi:hypothetical protein